MGVPRESLLGAMAAQPVSGGSDLSPGKVVQVQGNPGIIVAVLSMDEVLVRDKATGHTSKIAVDMVQVPGVAERQRPAHDLHGVPEAVWNVAVKRFDLIEGLRTGEGDVLSLKQQAEKAGVHLTTLYRWYQRFQAGDGRISALLPGRHPGGSGKSRLDPKVQAVIEAALKDLYLTKQRLKACVIYRLSPVKWCSKSGQRSAAVPV